ncbi:MAG TPA: hypothetical protein PKV38_14250, partial [bacterium]|nr:hypothetical protein [bacterium]
MKSVITAVKHFIQSEDGPTAVEYAVVAALVIPGVAAADVFRWNATGGGDWNDPTKWTLISGTSGRTYPNDATDVAQFYDSITADSVVNVNGTYTVKDIR